MRERITKFILMAAAVILIGTGITLFNWKGWGGGSQAGGAGVSMAADWEENIAVQVLEEEPNAVTAQTAAEEGRREREADRGEKDGAVSAQFDIGDETEQQKMGYCETEEAALISGDSAEQITWKIFNEDTEEFFEEVVVESSGESIVILESFANWEDARDAYYSRLGEMDKKLTAKAEEAHKKPIADQKTIADEIWKFWDDELNTMYQELRGLITEEEFDALREEERAWLRSRDEMAAKAAASENSSSNAQNLAYTRSLAESTKERVYALIEMYYSYNQKESK